MTMASTARRVTRSQIRRGITVGAVSALAVTLSACGGSDAGSGSASGGGGGTEAITLITKDSTNPFFIAMQNGAKAAAKENDVKLTIAAGKEDGDEAGQITAIENAILQQQAGILITPNGPGVNAAIKKARDAKLFVIALDTPPDPADVVDITFATDNIKAGEVIGQWTAKKLDGKKAVVAMIDAFDDKLVATDYRRHNGFLKGLGVDLDTGIAKFADVPSSGSYGAGDYTIACQEPGQAAQDDSKVATENCLNKNKDINVVYAINEPAAFGARDAIKAAGRDDIMVVTIDGGCEAVDAIAKGGSIVATAQQYPTQMASLGMKAIADVARGAEKPATTEGLDFYDTGVALVTDDAVDGVDSISTKDAATKCWGK